jgi:2-hydroxychromene-2-carboxylate isomerase
MIRRIEWNGNRRVIVEQPFPPVSRFQAREALRMAGLFDAAEEAAAEAGGAVLRAWDEALEWQRDSPTIAALAEALGLTDAQVDDLFAVAATIRL